MSVIAIPKSLREKLGDEASEAFVDIINKVDGESKKELATKADIAALKSDILLLETRLDSKIRLYFIILAFLFLITNHKAIDLLSKLIGMVK
ncbi:MAG: hypothetical protein HQL01_05850 [Nitrospirae bacterium]|nr:hypothetical protein [Nitrospirota bacterium]